MEKGYPLKNPSDFTLIMMDMHGRFLVWFCQDLIVDSAVSFYPYTFIVVDLPGYYVVNKTYKNYLQKNIDS